MNEQQETQGSQYKIPSAKDARAMAKAIGYTPEPDRLKRFVWFSYPEYYPGGGACDVEGQADTLDEMVQVVAIWMKANPTSLRDYHDILDLQERMWLPEQTVKDLLDKARAMK